MTAQAAALVHEALATLLERLVGALREAYARTQEPLPTEQVFATARIVLPPSFAEEAAASVGPRLFPVTAVGLLLRANEPPPLGDGAAGASARILDALTRRLVEASVVAARAALRRPEHRWNNGGGGWIDAERPRLITVHADHLFTAMSRGDAAVQTASAPWLCLHGEHDFRTLVARRMDAESQPAWAIAASPALAAESLSSRLPADLHALRRARGDASAVTPPSYPCAEAILAAFGSAACGTAIRYGPVRGCKAQGGDRRTYDRRVRSGDVPSRPTAQAAAVMLEMAAGMLGVIVDNATEGVAASSAGVAAAPAALCRNAIAAAAATLLGRMNDNFLLNLRQFLARDPVNVVFSTAGARTWLLSRFSGRAASGASIRVDASACEAVAATLEWAIAELHLLTASVLSWRDHPLLNAPMMRMPDIQFPVDAEDIVVVRVTQLSAVSAASTSLAVLIRASELFCDRRLEIFHERADADEAPAWAVPLAVPRPSHLSAATE